MRALWRLVVGLVLLASMTPDGAALGIPPLDAPITIGSPQVDVRAAAAGLELQASVAPIEVPPLLEPARAPTLPETPSVSLAPAPTSSVPPADDAAEIASISAAATTTILWLLVERLGLGRALAGAFAALYLRVQPSELLENERRERVVRLVRERPGIGPQDIASSLGTGWGVTSYHLDRLERAGILTSQRVGHHRCYFVPGALPREQQRNAGLFRAQTARRVAELIARRPGLTQGQLATELGLSASAMSKQVARLASSGLLRREPGQEGIRLYPEPAMTGMLVHTAA